MDNMRTKIPGTDLQSFPIALGGASLGSSIRREDAFRLMDEFVDAGGNMVDTAQVYANWLPDIEPSISERVIGQWMAERGLRSRMIVTTKGAHPLLHSMDRSRMSEEDIRQDVDGSLQRLRVDEIDLYWLHRDDTDRTVGEILETMNRFVREGKIRYFGCSNWSVERIRDAARYAAEHGLQGFAGNQMMWSLASADRSLFQDPSLVPMDEEMYRYHLESGMAALPYSSQAQGLFAKWERGEYAKDDNRISPQYRSPENVGRFERCLALASELDVSVNRIVLAYLSSQPFPTVPIAGCRMSAQLRDSLSAAGLRLSKDQLAYLERGISL
ncbi:aldo/keto reductase [Cohnella zeiphila]|uniref:Aldo/keto reductase n=1 Tax=Cohnella zeiphila TaxID=2761120 RepID=A0A7X0VYZ3_9BACL|nr:aldo/keto reductase [Cohnella zeiphila]MBB6735022.1 aldo/keto reductase [Cohnella zeiphila]